LEKIEKEAHIVVQVTATSPEPDISLPFGWIKWPVLIGGLLLGGLLAWAVHRYVSPRVTVIEDETMLANKLRAPVLGVVPRLAALARH